ARTTDGMLSWWALLDELEEAGPDAWHCDAPGRPDLGEPGGGWRRIVFRQSGVPSPVACDFFFSSRRRHTRFSRDWSSDVCSSDLTTSDFAAMMRAAHLILDGEPKIHSDTLAIPLAGFSRAADLREAVLAMGGKIGRASCRERGEGVGGAEQVDRRLGVSRSADTVA